MPGPLPPPVVLFLDTSAYLHFGFPADFDWSRELHASRALVVVPPVVLWELDKHKDSGTKVLRGRAGSVLKRLSSYDASSFAPEGAALWSSLHGVDPAMFSTLRTGVDLYFDMVEPAFDPADKLAPDRQDDRFIASLLRFVRANPTVTVQVRARDFGLGMKLRRFRIVASQPPPEAALPEEQDPDQKTIADLRKQLAELEAATPKVRIGFANEQDEPESTLRYKLVVPRAPTGDEIEAIVATAATRCEVLPEVTVMEVDAQHGVRKVDAGLRRDRVKEYNERRDPYFNELRTFLASFRDTNPQFRCVPIDFIAFNSGGKPAESVRIELEFPPNVEVTSRPPLPPPQPAPPKKPSVAEFFRTEAMLAPMRYDPSRFNIPLPPTLKEAHIDGSTVVYQQGQVTHGFEYECATLYATFPSIEAIKPFEIAYSIHADNAPKRTEGKLRVVVELADGDDPMLRSIIADEKRKP